MNRKMESLINGASNGFHWKSCENMKENLSFLQKELLPKYEFIKSLLETKTAILNSLSNSESKPASLSSSRNYIIKMKKKLLKIKQVKVNIKSNNPSKGKKKM